MHSAKCILDVVENRSACNSKLPGILKQVGRAPSTEGGQEIVDRGRKKGEMIDVETAKRMAGVTGRIR